MTYKLYQPRKGPVVRPKNVALVGADSISISRELWDSHIGTPMCRLFYDEIRSSIGIGPALLNSTEDTLKVSHYLTGVRIRCQGFFKEFKLIMEKHQNFPITWNQNEGLLEIKIRRNSCQDTLDQKEVSSPK